MGRLTPLIASVLPNTTVRLFVDAGSNPTGVNAVTMPANATAMTVNDNIMYKYERFLDVRKLITMNTKVEDFKEF